MSKQVRYGDQVYIEISDLVPPPANTVRFLCSNSFLEDNVFGVNTTNFQKASFRNCVFTILPSLIDSREDLEILHSLGVELSFLSLSAPNTAGEQYLQKEIKNKTQQIELSTDTIQALNKKIMSELENNCIRYGEVVILQHAESGYYLSADSSYHPHNPSFYNLRLQKERTSSCYFKFYSYSVPNDRSFIDYENEMKLISAYMNTVVTAGETRDPIDGLHLTSEDDEKEDVEKPLFPADLIRRDVVLRSFNMEPQVIGTVLESKDNNRIRLIEFCSGENVSSFEKRKVIKNGDYVRFQLDDFYLTASKSIYRESIGLYNHQTEGYKYSFINSIFQIIAASHSSEIPKADEVQTNSKKMDESMKVDKFYIKHFVTGHYLSLPEEKLIEQMTVEDDMAERPSELPYFTFVNNQLKNSKNSLSQNSRVALKASHSNQRDGGKFYIESDLEKYQIVQIDLSSKYFVGFKNPEDKIKGKLKLVKKNITSNQVVGSSFKVNRVSHDEMKQILEFESYANALKRFITVLQCVFKQHTKIKSVAFYAELCKVLNLSEQLKLLLKSHNAMAHVLAREFRILDMVSKLLFYFLVSPSIEAIFMEKRFKIEEAITLTKNLTDIILNATNENELTHRYVSQYVRVFISALFNPSPLFKNCTKIQSEGLKDCVVSLLYRFLWDRDLDTLGQLNYYDEPFFESLDSHADYSVHLLQVLDHFFKSKAPNLDNELRRNFIKNYIGDPNRLRKIFPKIYRREDLNDFAIEFERENHPKIIMMREVPPEVINYIIWVFRLINSIGETRSIKFWNIVINYYSEQLCEDLLNAPEIQPKLKNETLILLKNCHFAYGKLPFETLPPKIQFIFPSELLTKHKADFDKLIIESEEALIEDRELQVIKQVRSKSRQLTGFNIQKLSLDILSDQSNHLQKGNLQSLSFALQIMSNILQDERNLTAQSLCMIHHSLSGIVIKVAQELASKQKGLYFNPFFQNAEKVFRVISEVDKLVIRFAFKESIEGIREEILQAKNDISKLGALGMNNQTIISTIFNNIERHIMTKILSTMSEEWKSKSKLYQLANMPLADMYLESRVIEALWSIVESGEEWLANIAVDLIRDKTNFETKITQELMDCALFREDTEVDELLHLASSLLTLNKISRRLQVKNDFELQEGEGERTLDEVIQHLEKIFTIIYDYQQHMKDESNGLSLEETKDTFLKRFRNAKVKNDNEIPFRYKTQCVKTLYQRVLKLLQAHEILIPLIRPLRFQRGFDNVSTERTNLAYRLIMAICILFVHNNTSNQNIIASYPEFITLFYDGDLERCSVECPAVFAEMCTNNRKLLTLSEDYLFVVTAYNFVDILNPFTIDKDPKNADNSAHINYLKSLPFLLSSEIPRDMFSPAEFIVEKFFDFHNFMVSDKRLSLAQLIKQKEIVSSENENLIKMSLESDRQSQKQNIIEIPLFYLMVKELLAAAKDFALTNHKDRVLVLHNSFTIDRVIPFLSNENIEFNFELKQLTLQFLENLYFKNVYKNTNLFHNYDHFLSFISALLIDIYGYFQAHIESTDPIFDLFETSYFPSEENKSYVRKYKQLVRSVDLDGIVFLEYQSLTMFSRIWKDYIYYVLCEFFGNFIVSKKDFMLLNRGKNNNYQNMFEIWFNLITVLYEKETEPKYHLRIETALKSAVVHSEYAKYRNTIYSTLANHKKQERKEISKPKKDWDINIQKILYKYLGPKSVYKVKYAETNLANIVSNISSNKDVLKKLVQVLLSPETEIKDTVFVLRLFRKVIESQNRTEANKDKPIYLWGDVSSGEFKKINRLQEILNEINIVEAVFSLFTKYEKNPYVLKEILLLSIALLFGGNKSLQNSFYDSFRLDFENEVLDNFTRILEESIDLFSVQEKKKTKDAYFKTLQSIFNYFEKSPTPTPIVNTISFEIPDQLKKQLTQELYYKDSENMEQIASYQENEYSLMVIILKFLQSLCEGHYLKFQEFLRDQTIVEHSKCSNIPEFLRQAYHTYYKFINVNNLDIGVQILNLLIEMEQGESVSNVGLLLRKTFISDLCETLTAHNNDLDLLARGFESNASHPKFMKIKYKVLIILKDIVERSEPVDLIRTRQYVNLSSLVSTFKENLVVFHNKKRGYPITQQLLAEDIWDPNLSSAFMVYFILKHLSVDETSEDFIPEIEQILHKVLEDGKGLSPQLAHRYLTIFFKKYTGSIEIWNKKSKKVMRIYFPISVVYDYLKPETKDYFDNHVDRSNTQTKIADFMEYSDEIIAQVEVGYNSRKRLFGLNFYTVYDWLRIFSNMITLVVTFFNIFTLKYNEDEQDVEYSSEEYHQLQIGLNVSQSVFSFILIILWLHTRLNKFLAFQWDTFVNDNVKEQGQIAPDILQKIGYEEEITHEIGKLVLLLKGPYSEEWQKVKHLVAKRYNLYNLWFLVHAPDFLWHLIYFGVCIGSIFHPLAAAFQLFDIIIRSDTINRVALAMSMNARQFLWTLVLLLVTVYAYSLIALYFLHERFATDDQTNYCYDAYSCFLANLNYGLRSGGGIADAIKSIAYDPEDKGIYFGYTIYDLSFFIIMIILLLNLIFGMIIDAFGELRDEKNNNEDDKLNVCFVCGLPRSEYERTASFDRHITEEHDIWKYLAYIIYLQQKSKIYATDLTDVEDYVLDRYNKKDNVWFPVGRSLTLERQLAREEKEKKSETSMLRDEIMGVLDKIVEKNTSLATEIKDLKSGLSRIPGFKK